jgi:hypothetical protein
MIRVVLAGILGGIAMFIGGAFSHMFLELESRAFQRLPNENAAREFVTSQTLQAGAYGFPAVAENFNKMTAAEQGIEYERVNTAFRTGPSGTIFIAPTGEDMMGTKQLAGEFIADVIAATLAAFIASHLSTFTSFARRWLLIVLIAPIAWLSLTASFVLWYHFPLSFIQDGFFAALIEWTVAGAVIAAVVRPIMHSR